MRRERHWSGPVTSVKFFKMTRMRFTLRRATLSDADAVANVYSTSFRLLAFLLLIVGIVDKNRARPPQ